MKGYKSTKQIAILGIIGNIFLCMIKFIAALSSHSKALMVDAMNSFGDIFSCLMTYFGNRILIKVHKNQNKIEYLYSLFISILMFLLSCKTLVNSFISLITKQKFIFSSYLIIVCILTISVKLILYIHSKRVYENTPNILIKTSMIDHKNDILLSLGTLTATLAGNFGFFVLDGLFGLGISLYILICGFSIFIESYQKLVNSY